MFVEKYQAERAMKRREFIVKSAVALAAVGPGRSRAGSPCPLPTVIIDTKPPTTINTPCEPPPAWVPAPGQWAAVGLNTLVDVQGPSPVSGDGFATNNGFHKIWAGGAYAPHYGGTYGSMIYGPNGGHNSYDGNDVYAYDIESRLCLLAKATYNPTSDGINSFGEFPDGSPCPPHGYDAHVVLPNVGASGSLVVPATYNDLDLANWCSWSHLLDLATGKWSRGPDFVDPVHMASAYDPIEDVAWFRAEPAQPLTKFDGVTRTTFPGNRYAIDTGTVATIDTKRHHFVHWDGRSLRHLFVTDLASPNTQPTAISLPSGPGSCAFEYVPELDRIVAWNGGKTVYTLNPNDYAAGWQVQGTASNVTPPSPVNDSYSKYMYVPGIQCLIGISDVDTPAYAYRPIAI